MKILSRRNFLLGAAAAAICGAVSWPLYRAFGASAEGNFASPNWHGGSFHNLSAFQIDSVPAGEPVYPHNWLEFFFSRGNNRWPDKPVRSAHEDIKNLRDGQFVWLGHSSLLIRLAGKIICIDPILSSHASPVPFTIRAWPGSTPYSAADFPQIDYLCITHDHWDHLDYATVRDLSWKKSFCGLGTGAHFRYWGMDAPHEMDWRDEYRDKELKIIFIPSMHFSGRGTVRNKSLWGGFYLDAGSGGKVLFTGDGGFGSHFEEFKRLYGKPDIIFTDSGQYNRAWNRMHMFPEQAVQAALDSGAPLACPVHIGKFSLSWHPWHEPFERFSKKAREVGQPYILPAIGEIRSIG